MFTIIKSLNNNIVLAKSEDTHEELILFGNGIGFKKKKGDDIDPTTAKKIFSPQEGVEASRILESIPAEVLSVTEKVVSMGEKDLNTKLNHSILLSLADHIHFAIEREDDSLNENPLQWEIPYLYFAEHKIGNKALEMIEESLGKKLPEIEASFIALHFVNAQTDSGSMKDTMQITKLINNIIYIIEHLFEVELDKTTISYSRFITHLRYFFARQKMKQQAKNQMDDQFVEIIQEKYMKSYACVLIIREMIGKEFQWKLTEDEVIYLVIHVERLTKENKK